MKRSIEKGSEEWQFWKDIYAYRVNFHEPEKTESEYWNEMDTAGRELAEKYKDTPFANMARQIILCIVEESDRSFQEKRKKGVL